MPRFLQQILQFVLYSNLFIAVGACLGMYGTACLFQISISFEYFALMFLGTLCSYCIHWYFTYPNAKNREREKWSIANKKLLLTLAVLSLIGGMYIFFAYGIKTLFWFFPIIIFTAIYTAPKIPYATFMRLRKFVIAKTLYLTLGWWYCTSVLPFLPFPKFTHPMIGTYLWYRFVLIFLICFIFDYRDKQIDISAGIKSLIKFVSGPVAKTICQVLLAVCCVSLSNMFGEFVFFKWFSLCVPVLVLLATHVYSLQQDNDLWYYGVLDAMLFISGVLMLGYCFNYIVSTTA
jgi:type IV secretory pathway VirB2 component (pilin)